MAVRLRALVLAAVFLALVAAAAHGDEIRLKNGSVIEGVIIKETPDEVVVKTEYGTVTIRRVKIESIRRYRGPSRFKKTPPADTDTAGPPPGAKPIPGSKAYFTPPPSPWNLDRNERMIVYARGTDGTLSLFAIPTPGMRHEDFMKFVHDRKEAAPPGSVLLQEKTYLHGGRPAFELAYETPGRDGTLNREYLVDLEDQKVMVRLTGSPGTVKSCVPGYLAVLESLGAPHVTENGRTLDVVPVAFGHPHLTVTHHPPAGPWEFEKKAGGKTTVLTYARTGRYHLLVMLGFWDGHGKLARKIFKSYFEKMGALSLSGVTFEKERYYDKGLRVEYSAACRAEMLGVPFEGTLFSLHEHMAYITILGLARKDLRDRCREHMERLEDSIRFEKDWKNALSREHWNTVPLENIDASIALPRWWSRRGNALVSPGASMISVQAGRDASPFPSMDTLNRYIAATDTPAYSRIRITKAEDLHLPGREGRRLILEGAFQRHDLDLDVKGQMIYVRSGERFVFIIFFSPGTHVDRQNMILQKVVKSVRFK